MLPHKLSGKVKIVIGPNNGNERLDVVVAEASSARFSRETAKEHIRQGYVLVGGEIEKRPSRRLKVGDLVVFPKLEDETMLLGNSTVPFPVLFEDDQCIFINKPAGVSMHPLRGGQGDTLAHGIVFRNPDISGIGNDALRPGIVHRLDRNTSGVVVIAKTEESFLELKEAFESRRVHKEYFAVVAGNVANPFGVIRFPIGQRTGTLRRAVAVGPSDDVSNIRFAETEYRLNQRFPSYDTLDLFPKTGRTHQIRVHCAALGHPVIGDRLYGGKRMKRVDMPSRQLLHARRISFDLLGTSYDVEAPLPQDILSFLSSIDGKKESGYPGEASGR